MKKNIFFRSFILIATLLFFTQQSVAQFEEGKEVILFGLPAIYGTGITASATNTTSWSSAGEYDKKIKNIITFKINESFNAYLQSGFSATVYFKIDSKITLASSPVQTSRELTVHYDTAYGSKYDVRAYIILPEAEEIKITVDSINITGSTGGFDPINFLHLENEMRILRYYALSDNATYLTPTFNSPVIDTSSVQVSWVWDDSTKNNISQLEWAWVEHEMADFYPNTDSLFEINSTRVDLDFVQNDYQIPLLYDGEGKLYYRVRAAQRKNDGSVITGPWSDADSISFNGHERDMNWQSSTSFAENGKFKSVIQYFDGSLRNRQTVTKDNSTGNTVVAETIYDLQGRPNIQILPTPTIGSTIKYFKDFNRFVGQTTNDNPAKYFDLITANEACNSAVALDSNYGNGKYYSNLNPWIGIEQNASFIPDAQGYAFTETRFTDDATERVKSQGGVGIKHQIASGHETTYYYGKPTQQELDALFATEVGDASHYSKNMVRDANGQMSVSYVDMHGRTIATALAGDSTTGISGIATDTTDYPLATGTLTNKLLTPLTNTINGNSIESISTILVPATTIYNFTYKLDPSILSQFDCDSTEVCFDCKYDLEISIRSEECGDSTPKIRRYNNLQIVPAVNACDSSRGFTGESVTNVKQINFSETLGVGSWVVRKTLTLNDSMFRVRRDSALKAFLCKTEQSIYDSVYTILYSTSGCGLSPDSAAIVACDSCNANLGAFSTYRIRYLTGIGADTLDDSYDEAIHVQYSRDSSECANICGALNVELTTLQSLRKQMLAHMMPFTGQYAIDSIRIDSTGAAYPLTSGMLQSKYNIFTTIRPFGSYTKPLYRNPLNENNQVIYYTEDMEVDSTIHRHDENNDPILDTISREGFAGLFQHSWAGSLIKYHPEYPALLVAEGPLRRSYEWLDSMQAIDTYAAAFANGFTNPLALPGSSAHPDPFFQMAGNSLYKDTMDARIREGIYIIAGPTGTEASIWQIANGAVLCEGEDSASKAGCISGLTIDGLDPSITLTASKNRVWEVFRGLYLGYRNEMVMKYIHAQTGVLTRTEMDSLHDEGKHLVFASLQDVATQNNAGGWWATVATGDTSGTGGIMGAITDSLGANRCAGQKPFWKARLLQCEALIELLNNQTSGDSILVNNIIDSILVGMVSVCNNSRDARHLYGASNVRPSYVGSPRDFEAVINYVLDDNEIDTAGLDGYFCNPYTIDFPKPYGKNPPLLINYSNKIDSCGCIRFAELKTEAHSLSYDTTSFTSMNTFLKTNYSDSLTLVVWEGLQYCDSLYTDSCTTVTGSAGNYPYSAMRDTTYDSLPDTCASISLDFAVYVNHTLSDNVLVEFTTGGYTNCILHLFDVYNNFYASYALDCNSDLIYLSLPPCNTFKLLVQAYTDSICNAFSDTLILYPLKTCSDCEAPEINSVTINPPNPTDTTQVVTVNYVLPSSCSNCILNVYAQNNPVTPLYTQTLDCDSTSVTLEIASCYKYRFQVRCDVSDDCLQIPSNNVLLDSCLQQQCHRTYYPIYLPEVSVIPPFLNCDYVKPCINCDKLTELTEEFRARFPSFSSAPYLDSAATEAETQQNGLWARFLNYRTGFSLTVAQYLGAYAVCQDVETVPPGYLICSFSMPVNDPGDILQVDTVPCRNVETQAQFITQMLYQQMKDSLIAKFDSLYKATCFAAKDQEQFYATYQPKEYHYTLYYYDQAGNLVKTIPPAGVKPYFDSTYLASVEAARTGGTDVSSNNNDSLATFYRYNTLNQVVAQRTPDAGISKFWYDRLGRLVVSQNAKQRTSHQYSYTLYDELGRITEVGQSTNDSVMTQAISQDTADLAAWIADVSAGTKKQITLTMYDKPYTSIAVTHNGLSGLYQQNLRNRVSYSMVFDDETQKDSLSDGTIKGGNSATYYSYDIHGNVDTLLQDYKTGMGAVACDTFGHNRYKKLVYYYDLISGKVNDVAYQQGAADQFFHRYVYDAENRITSVKTSKDKIYWEQDAEYSYYRHGPLSRTVLGHNQVQGLDYAYTIQGWLKGVNSTSVDTALFDMGLDGNVNAVNNWVARDAVGFSLNYFTGDYKPVDAAVTPFTTVPMNLPADPVSGISTGHQLFNGNIGAMAVNITKLASPIVYGYRYDQLNRIVRMDAFNGFNNATNTLTANRLNDYHEAVTYDPNGNIRTYLRNGSASQLSMDDLAYTYTTNTNKLKRVTDAVSSGNYPDDIDHQSNTTNYVYDEIGNLIEDKAEGIDSIQWTVYGKIKRIVKGGTVIDYTYDAAGNRISKAVTVSAVTKTTYYVRDASGNVMSIYQAGDNTINSGDLTQTEVHLYGSSRLGVFNVNNNVLCAPDSTDLTIFTRGNKFFELSNHLGNVLVTISDKKIAMPEYVCGFGGCEWALHHYEAEVITANDYYPFGMGMPGREFDAGSGYRYGFNGKERDKEVVQYDYGFRIYDPRLGRFLSVDPLTKKFPMLTPYQFASNTPISAIDLDGKEAEIVVDKEAKTAHVNFKFTYSDVSMKTMEQFELALTDITNSFNYYYKPDADGETQATKDAAKATGKSKAELETLLGGKIASGGDGFFNVDFGSSGVYKVFYTIVIDNKLNPKKDITVSQIEVHPAITPDEEAETNESGIHIPVTNKVNKRSFGTLTSHEIGHIIGNSDFYKILQDNPFLNRMAKISVTTDEGTSDWFVGELMDRGPTHKVISEVSIQRTIGAAIKMAETVKKNKVTLLSGKGNQYKDPMTKKPKSSISKPKIIKKSN